MAASSGRLCGKSARKARRCEAAGLMRLRCGMIRPAGGSSMPRRLACRVLAFVNACLSVTTALPASAAPRALQDKMGLQTFSFKEPVKADWIQFIIDEVYPGSKYTDTALSRLLVTATPLP